MECKIKKNISSYFPFSLVSQKLLIEKNQLTSVRSLEQSIHDILSFSLSIENHCSIIKNN